MLFSVAKRTTANKRAHRQRVAPASDKPCSAGHPRHHPDAAGGGEELKRPSEPESEASEEIRAAAAARKQHTLRELVFLTMEEPSFSPLAKWTSVAMMLVILLSTVCFILESEVDTHRVSRHLRHPRVNGRALQSSRAGVRGVAVRGLSDGLSRLRLRPTFSTTSSGYQWSSLLSSTVCASSRVQRTAGSPL